MRVITFDCSYVQATSYYYSRATVKSVHNTTWRSREERISEEKIRDEEVM